MLKNIKRFVETLNNKASYIKTFSLSDNFQNSRKKRTKEINLVLEAVFRRCSIKKVFLEISQNLQENTCVRLARASFLIKLQALNEYSINYSTLF